MKHLAKLLVLAAVAVLPALPAWGEPIEVELLGNGPRYGSPVIAEVDGNTANGKEIVVASANGIISAVSATGQVLWETTLPIYACTATSNSNKLLSTPAVGELNGNGVPYVVVGYGGIAGKECGGGVVALRGSTGAIAWNFDLKKFAQRNPIYSVSHSVISSPALYDFDDDGKLEVTFGALDRNIYVVSSTGRLKGYYQAADTVFSSPAIADADNDGSAEIVIGTDISQNLFLRPPTPNGGYLYALKSSLFRRGRVIGFRQTGSAVWRAEFDQVVQASPTIGELIASNPGLEVVTATGCYFPENSSNKRGRYLKVFSLKNGKLLRKLPLSTCSLSEGAIADVNGDSVNEVIMPVQALSFYGGTTPGQILAYNAQENRVIWKTSPSVGGNTTADLALYSGPVVADLDKNGSLEVIITGASGFAVLKGTTGRHLSCEERDCFDGRLSFHGLSTIRNAVAVGDLDGNGKLELVAVGTRSRRGLVRIYTDWDTLISSTPGTGTNPLPWPMFRGNQAHTAARLSN